jgi:hypothetical protein
VGPDAQPSGLEPGVSLPAGLGFPCGNAQGKASDFTRQSIPERELPHLLGHCGTVWMNAVVHVGHHKIQPMPVPAPGEEVEQGHRVRSAGDSDKNPAGRQAEAGEVRLELFGQLHTER